MSSSIFDFNEYKQYLTKVAGGQGSRQGVRLALAKAAQVQPAMISAVLNGAAQLSLEQAERLNRFLGHSEEEGEYFFLLVQHERAGSVELSAYWKKKIADFLSRRQEVVQRLGKRNSLSKEDQGIYYSSWHYAAFHIAVSVSGLGTADALAKYFSVPLKKVKEVLETLVSMDLITEESGSYKYGEKNLRLGRDSHNILKHHTNWRQQAAQSFDRETAADLHYSAVLSLSKKTQMKIKDLLLEGLKGQLALVEQSETIDEVAVLCIDLFSLNQG